LTRAFDLLLPEPERRRAAALATRWQDLLYVPGPGFTSPLDSGLYRSSFVIVPGEGRAVRVSSFVVPAFGSELSRLRIEPTETVRADALGSFFEPARRGAVHVLSADRRTGGPRPPDRPEWSYRGPSLRPRLERAARVRLLRERVSGGSGDSAFSWVADRGLVIAGADDRDVVLLAGPDGSEQALLVTDLGFYRVLLDPAGPATPGASVRELLGYGERDDLRVEVEVEWLGHP
jgi:hypothetical protein